jgi:hypothetical protein
VNIKEYLNGMRVLSGLNWLALKYTVSIRAINPDGGGSKYL